VEVQRPDERHHVVLAEELVHVREAFELPEGVEHLRLLLGPAPDQNARDHRSLL
jgi:hypothetical protein